jgi:iron complex outermembrane receptor protein
MIDVGVFAELTTVLDSRWRLTTGGRIDGVRTHTGAVYSAVDPLGDEHVFDFGSEVDRGDALYHAFVSADYDLHPSLTLRFGFGHGQRPPSLTERFALEPFLTVVQTATSAVLGDPDLKPERASQFDLALVGDYDDARFRVAGFWSYVADHITFATAVGLPPTPDVKLLDFVNNDATLAGAELAAECDLTPALAPFANFKYLTGRNLLRDEPLPAIYPLEARLGVRWHDPCDDRYGIEFVARLVGHQDQVAVSLAELPTAGFTTYDLRGYWQALERLRVIAGLENLFDKNYLEHLNVHVPAVLEPGLNFYVATQMDF